MPTAFDKLDEDLRKLLVSRQFLTSAMLDARVLPAQHMTMSSSPEKISCACQHFIVLQYEALKKAKVEALAAGQAAAGKQPLDPLGQVIL